MPNLIQSTFWSAIQRFGGLAIGFISNVVLARLLCPEDYGVVGLIMVFIGIADVLVDGGLGNALIQKKEVTKEDVSTVFTSNLIISLFLFVVLFVTAPSIASYVEIEKFALYLRVEAVMVLLRALYVVHFSMLNREMEFKTLAKINLLVNALATTIAITMAYYECGVWSLILRNISLDFLFFIVYHIVYKTKYTLSINKQSFKQLFGFGIFVAIANLVETLYTNILSFILGKKFSVKELGYYNQAYSLEQIPVYSITSILNQVFFPFLSKEQDDKNKMRVDIEKSLRAMSFLIYPLMAFLIFFAKPLIILLYSEKWLPSVPFFQILCTLGFTNFIYHLNRSVLKAVGKSKLLFYAQIVVSLIGLLLIIISIKFGIIAVVVSVALNSIIGMLVVSYFAGISINLNIFVQLRDVVLNLILSLLTGVIVYWLSTFVSLNPFALISVALVVFIVIYMLFHIVIKSSSYRIVMATVKAYYQQRNRNKVIND